MHLIWNPFSSPLDISGLCYAHQPVLRSFCCYSILLVDCGYYILARQADGPCEYSMWIIVVMLDLALQTSKKLFVGWVGHCSANILLESASSKFLVCLWGKIIYCRRFEKIWMRIARGLSAMCLLVIFMVVAYDVLVIQSFSSQMLVPTARYFGGPNPVQFTQKPWHVYFVSVFIQTPSNLHHLICWPDPCSWRCGYTWWYEGLHDLDQLWRKCA